MLILETKNQSVISFFFPLLTRKFGINAMPFVSYRRKMNIFAASSFLLVAIGFYLLLLDDLPDEYFNAYASLIFIFGVIRFTTARARQKIILSEVIVVRRAPLLAWVDFGGFMISAGIMDLIVGKFAFHDSLRMQIGVIGIVILALSFLPLANIVAFSVFGLGKIRQ